MSKASICVLSALVLFMTFLPDARGEDASGAATANPTEVQAASPAPEGNAASPDAPTAADGDSTAATEAELAATADEAHAIVQGQGGTEAAQDGAAPTATEAELAATSDEAHATVQEKAGAEAASPAAASSSGVPASTVAHESSPSDPLAPGMTRVRFTVSAGRKPYAVSMAGSKLICQAPCMLDVPNGDTDFVFLTGVHKYKFQAIYDMTLEGGSVDLELMRPHSTAKKAGGAVLTGLGGAALALGITGLVMELTYDDSDSSHDNSYFGIAMMAVGFPLAIGLLIPGTIMLAKSRPVIEERRYGASAAYSTKDAIRDSFNFAIVPTRDGAAASAGFRF